ncbi:MAG: hypothetical protein AUJ82_07985 [Verrucomicrobia bacterium CG1_02_43_26]|nr:MAG: hypothetical protein AUJ82_07985 [Verrucomicrobia bacterium CG1_02_43_26]
MPLIRERAFFPFRWADAPGPFRFRSIKTLTFSFPWFKNSLNLFYIMTEDASTPTHHPLTELEKTQRSIRIIAWTLLLLGALSAANVVAETFRGVFFLDIRVIFLLAGWGLLRRSEFWRRFSFVCSTFVFIYSLIILTLLFLYWLKVLNMFTVIPNIWTVLLAIVSCVISGWVCWVISRTKVKQYFLSKTFE